MKQLILSLSLFIFSYGIAHCQVNYTANDHVKKYTGPFSFGSNGGYYPKWNGEQIRDIFFGNPSKGVKGAGATGIRYTLPNAFLEQWGYDISLNGYKANEKAGAFDNVCFLEKPSDKNKSLKEYCPGHPSFIFKNIDLPIWDNNNGTPVNENNTYAFYVYETVKRYKGQVKFWEVWNEPDHTTSSHGWENATYPASWLNVNPDPCDLDFFLAPVQAYVRMLRISYEVIKTVDPEAYVTTGGIGYGSFLEAVLRNTDNPDNGKVSTQFPLKGGAYFDVLSYHSYPQYALTTNRHSDAAANAIIDHKNALEKILFKYGYNGQQYPQKEFIITEFNLSRKSFGKDFGSEEAQKNFILKVPVLLQQNQVRQMYIYGIAERRTLANATQSYDLMGLYEDLNQSDPYQQKITTEGIAFRTASKILYHAKYDATATKDLALPANVGGGAFRTKTGGFIYVLWAKTASDKSENASAQYTFPTHLKINKLEIRKWNFSETNDISTIINNSIALQATPLFLTNFDQVQGAEESLHSSILDVAIAPNPTYGAFNLNFKLDSPETVTVVLFDNQGKVVKTMVSNEFYMAGEHTMYFSHENFKSGVYYCQFKTESGAFRSEKIVIVK